MRTRLVIPAALLVAAAYVKGRQDALPHERNPAGPPAPVDLPDEVRRRAEAEAADAMDLAREPSVEGARAEVAATLAPPLRAEDLAVPDPWDAVRDWIVPEFPFARARAVAPEPRIVVGEPPATPEASPPVAARPAVPAEPGIALAAVPERSAEPAPAASAPVGPPRPADPALSEWAAPVAPMAPAVAPVAAAPEVEVEIDETGRFSVGGWAAQAGHMALTGVTFRDRRDAPVEAGAIRLIPDALSNVADAGVVVLEDARFAPCAEGFTLLVAAAGPGTFAVTGRYEVLAG